MKKYLRVTWLFWVAMVAVGCGDDDIVPTARRWDAAAPRRDDASAQPTEEDAGETDAEQADASAPDAAVEDATLSDADLADATLVDASLPDASAPDASQPSYALPGPLEIKGSWESNFGGTETIDTSSWVSYGTVTVVRYDNALNIAITKNADDATYNPGKFSKIVWTEPSDGSFYYCTIDFGLDSADAAAASTKVANDTSPETTGCGSFPWTKLSGLEIQGEWASNFGGTETFTSTTFKSYGTSALVQYDNTKNLAVTQNPADATYNPSKFSKLIWTQVSADSFHYCTVDYGLDTAADALASTKTADATKLDTTGCNGFPWTKLTRVLEIIGTFTSSYGNETIDSEAWTSFGTAKVHRWDNTFNIVITQNPADDAYNPSKFNKVVWTELSAESFYYCTVDFGLETADAAWASTKTANATTPDTSGCGSFGWTKLTRVPAAGGN